LQISEWKSQGFFTGSSAVMMRKVGIVGIDYIDDESKLKSKLLVRNDLFSSNTSINITNNDNKKRNLNNRDNDSLSNTIPGKKVKFQLENELNNEKKENFEDDLIHDFDDDDDDEVIIKSNNNCNNNSNNNDSISIDEVSSSQDLNIKGNWLSSDMIDFGSFVQLEDVVEGSFDDDDDDDDDDK
jgi:hypothetical protein